MQRSETLVIAVTTSFILASVAAGSTIRVPDDYQTIQDAIDAALEGDTVLVTPGQYEISGPITFLGKAITVNSEAGPNETTIRITSERARDSVVIFENEEGAQSVLEGFALTGGRGCYLGRHRFGGGVLCLGSSPAITNCTITGNSANAGAGDWDYGYGGGVCCLGSSPTFTDCTITGNSVAGAGEGEAYGGGFCCKEGSSPTLINCTIAGNSAAGDGEGDACGGGLCCLEGSSPTLTNCTITGNSVAGDGAGGVYGYGGGVYFYSGSSPTLTNCTIAENWPGEGIYCVHEAFPSLFKCIVWGNTGAAIQVETAAVVVAYTCLEHSEVWPGQGNINDDPLIAGDCRLSEGSPCIDTGTCVEAPPTDIEGNPRPSGAGCDMGAYEYIRTRFVRGDTNADSPLAIADAIFTLSYLFASGPAPTCEDAADANDDGAVDISDGIYILQNLFADGPAIPPPYPECGVDPTDDELGCEAFPPCEPAGGQQETSPQHRISDARVR